MNPRANTIIAGWVTLAVALTVSLSAAVQVAFTTREGAPALTVGLVTALLGFTAACFGIASHDRSVGARAAVSLEIAKLGAAPKE